MTSFNLNYLLKDLISKNSHIGGCSIYTFGGHVIQSTIGVKRRK